jgi:UDP-hydrolysing UDP-N-acetyl-D-glucosamine 2-epimerase
VHRAGAPSLDHLRRSKLRTHNELEIELKLDLSKPSTIVAYHPVTMARDTTYETSALFAALGERSEQILFCYPNADAGSRALIEKTRRFLEARANGRIFVNLGAVVYWSLLANVDLMVGNSSSGIIETASLALPTVNVGVRQYGRERARNVLDAEANKPSILEKIEEARSHRFKSSLEGMTNPYGDGHAAERIIQILTSVPLGADLLRKRASNPE